MAPGLRSLPLGHGRLVPLVAVAVALTCGSVAGCTTSGPTPSTDSAPGSTAVASTIKGLDALAAALDFARRTFPDANEQQTVCISSRIQDKPALADPARKPLDQLDLAQRKQLIRVLADCIGPEALMTLYETKHPVDPRQRQCVFSYLALDRPLDDAVSIVAGEPDITQKFEDNRDKKCASAATVPASGTPGSTKS